MGDSRRFDLFAKMIKKNFPSDKYSRIADIAGGKGYLQVALRSYGYNVTTFDKRRNKRNRPNRFQYQYRYFSEKIKEDFDLLVGMHPDEATDVIIVEAARRETPFLICPCCVKPSAIPYWKNHKYNLWMEHLCREAEKRNFSIQMSRLKMNGKSWCMIGKRL